MYTTEEIVNNYSKMPCYALKTYLESLKIC